MVTKKSSPKIGRRDFNLIPTKDAPPDFVWSKVMLPNYRPSGTEDVIQTDTPIKNYKS